MPPPNAEKRLAPFWQKVPSWFLGAWCNHFLRSNSRRERGAGLDVFHDQRLDLPLAIRILFEILGLENFEAVCRWHRKRRPRRCRGFRCRSRPSRVNSRWWRGLDWCFPVRCSRGCRGLRALKLLLGPVEEFQTKVAKPEIGLCKWFIIFSPVIYAYVSSSSSGLVPIPPPT